MRHVSAVLVALAMMSPVHTVADEGHGHGHDDHGCSCCSHGSGHHAHAKTTTGKEAGAKAGDAKDVKPAGEQASKGGEAKTPQTGAQK
ncbi:MAG TPA: hypothetical protein VFP65_29605 [Anaeromyxobacteraceae bacterium]|nr:hypothetical protein [Anaeromyxobacteraceae bacterium]